MVLHFFLKELDHRTGNVLAARYMSALQQHSLSDRLFMNLKEHID